MQTVILCKIQEKLKIKPPEWVAHVIDDQTSQPHKQHSHFKPSHFNGFLFLSVSVYSEQSSIIMSTADARCRCIMCLPPRCFRT